jgi:hypothetical protein
LLRFFWISDPPKKMPVPPEIWRVCRPVYHTPVNSIKVILNLLSDPWIARGHDLVVAKGDYENNMFNVRNKFEE